MQKSKHTILWVTLVLLAGLLSIVLYFVGRSSQPALLTPSTPVTSSSQPRIGEPQPKLPVQDPVADLATWSAAWASDLTSRGVVADSPQALMQASKWKAVSALQCDATGYRFDSDAIQAAVNHAANWLYIRFHDRTLNQTIAFVRQSGYLLPELADWKQLPYCSD